MTGSYVIGVVVTLGSGRRSVWVVPQRVELEDVVERMLSGGVTVEGTYHPCGNDHARAGWWCSRDRGHGGPCAAWPVGVTRIQDALS